MRWHFSFFIGLIALYLRHFDVSDASSCEIVDKYSTQNCKLYWNCTAQKLLKKWLDKNQRFILRNSLASIDVSKFGHTPMWLRVIGGKLYCVRKPGLKAKNFRMKVYRALHYINRINRILEDSPNNIPEDTEWWSHHSDINKILDGSGFPPIFSVSGGDGYADVAGIPFMSFSDKISVAENQAFEKVQFGINSKAHHELWKKRKSAAFFRGSLSDCFLAVQKNGGDINFCPRAKVVFEAVRTKEPLLQGISTISKFGEVGLNIECSNCTKNKLLSGAFINNLLNHKYVLDFPGAGSWSRRMSLLLRSGGAVFQVENIGYQFYDFNLKPGIHYIPFDAQIGTEGAGNLISRLNWAKQNDEAVQALGFRSESFGINCLSERSIDYFVSVLLKEYSKLLIGDMANFSMINLSSCRARNKKFSIAGLCSGVVEQCWD